MLLPIKFTIRPSLGFIFVSISRPLALPCLIRRIRGFTTFDFSKFVLPKLARDFSNHSS